MDLINILIISSVLVTTFLGLTVYFHRQGESHIYLVFSGVALSLSLWSIGVFSYRLTTNPDIAYIIAGFHYAIPLLIPAFFLHFVILYTSRTHISPLVSLSAYASAAILATGCIFSSFILQGIYIPPVGEKIALLGPGYVFYIAHYIFFFGIAFLMLLSTALSAAEKSEKRRALILLIGIVPITTIGLITNLLLPWFGVFAYNWVANIVMAFYAAFMFYAILRLHILNLKVVAAEVFTFFVLSFLLIELFLVRSNIELIVTAIVLIFVSILSYFSIRSFYREVDQRTKIEQLAENLRLANDRLKELDRLKSEFVSIASHQLRGPLTTIRGALSLVLDGTYGKIPKTANETLTRMFDTADLMSKSVEDFLNISRIEQGRMVYEMRIIDLEDLVVETTKEYMPIAKEKGLTLIIAPHAPRLPVHADYGKIKQVVSNLIDNAIKYTPKGSITVSLEALPRIARMVIQDTGVGMNEEARNKLFERFSRAPGASLVNVSGTGLGLYVAKQMVEAHHGTIRAESDGEGKGSRFIMELPTQTV